MPPRVCVLEYGWVQVLFDDSFTATSYLIDGRYGSFPWKVCTDLEVLSYIRPFCMLSGAIAAPLAAAGYPKGTAYLQWAVAMNHSARPSAHVPLSVDDVLLPAMPFSFPMALQPFVDEFGSNYRCVTSVIPPRNPAAGSDVVYTATPPSAPIVGIAFRVVPPSIAMSYQPSFVGGLVGQTADYRIASTAVTALLRSAYPWRGASNAAATVPRELVGELRQWCDVVLSAADGGVGRSARSDPNPPMQPPDAVVQLVVSVLCGVLSPTPSAASSLLPPIGATARVTSLPSPSSPVSAPRPVGGKFPNTEDRDVPTDRPSCVAPPAEGGGTSHSPAGGDAGALVRSFHRPRGLACLATTPAILYNIFSFLEPASAMIAAMLVPSWRRVAELWFGSAFTDDDWYNAIVKTLFAPQPHPNAALAKLVTKGRPAHRKAVLAAFRRALGYDACGPYFVEEKEVGVAQLPLFGGHIIESVEDGRLVQQVLRDRVYYPLIRALPLVPPRPPAPVSPFEVGSNVVSLIRYQRVFMSQLSGLTLHPSIAMPTTHPDIGIQVCVNRERVEVVLGVRSTPPPFGQRSMIVGVGLVPSFVNTEGRRVPPASHPYAGEFDHSPPLIRHPNNATEASAAAAASQGPLWASHRHTDRTPVDRNISPLGPDGAGIWTSSLPVPLLQAHFLHVRFSQWCPEAQQRLTYAFNLRNLPDPRAYVDEVAVVPPNAVQVASVLDHDDPPGDTHGAPLVALPFQHRFRHFVCDVTSLPPILPDRSGRANASAMLSLCERRDVPIEVAAAILEHLLGHSGHAPPSFTPETVATDAARVKCWILSGNLWPLLRMFEQVDLVENLRRPVVSLLWNILDVTPVLIHEDFIDRLIAAALSYILSVPLEGPNGERLTPICARSGPQIGGPMRPPRAGLPNVPCLVPSICSAKGGPSTTRSPLRPKSEEECGIPTWILKEREQMGDLLARPADPERLPAPFGCAAVGAYGPPKEEALTHDDQPAYIDSFLNGMTGTLWNLLGPTAAGDRARYVMGCARGFTEGLLRLVEDPRIKDLTACFLALHLLCNADAFGSFPADVKLRARYVRACAAWIATYEVKTLGDGSVGDISRLGVAVSTRDVADYFLPLLLGRNIRKTYRHPSEPADGSDVYEHANADKRESVLQWEGRVGDNRVAGAPLLSTSGVAVVPSQAVAATHHSGSPLSTGGTMEEGVAGEGGDQPLSSVDTSAPSAGGSPTGMSVDHQSDLKSLISDIPLGAPDELLGRIRPGAMAWRFGLVAVRLMQYKDSGSPQ